MHRGQSKGWLLLVLNWEIDNWEGYNSLAMAWRVELGHILVELAFVPLAFLCLCLLSKTPCLSSIFLLVLAECFAAFLSSGRHNSLDFCLNAVKFAFDIWVGEALHAYLVWLSNQIDGLGSLSLLARGCRRTGVLYGNVS